MAAGFVSLARWVAVPMVALAGATVTQAVVFLPFDAVVCGVMGICDGAVPWAAKTVTSVFMGFAFVALAGWTAPRAHSPTSLVALAAVIYWGARLMAAAFAKGFFVWLFAMGAAGIIGGVLAAVLVHWTATRQRSVARPEDAATEPRRPGALRAYFIQRRLDQSFFSTRL
jgi:hypothetical protein